MQCSWHIQYPERAGWSGIFETLKDRGVERLGLVVADGIRGLDAVVGEKFPVTPLQRCVTHLKRNLFAKVNRGDKGALVADLRDIFRTGQRDYTIETAWAKWQDMCVRWGKDYMAFKLMRFNADYKAFINIWDLICTKGQIGMVKVKNIQFCTCCCSFFRLKA